MVRTRFQSWRARPLRARIADGALVFFIALVAVAILVNMPSTIRDTKRGRVDLKVMKAYLKTHVPPGTYGLPLQNVHQKRDYACAFRKRSTEGLCIEIDSRTVTSTRILAVWTCQESPKQLHDPLPKPFDKYCPIRRQKAI